MQYWLVMPAAGAGRRFGSAKQFASISERTMLEVALQTKLAEFLWLPPADGSSPAEPLDPATAFHGVFKDGSSFKQKVKLLWLGMGTEEPNPFPAAIGSFRAMLDKAGIPYVYFSSPGTAHEWLTWRRDLNDFAPRLFQDRKN